MWGALSDERSGLYFSVIAGPRQRSLSRGVSPAGLKSVFFVSIFRLSQSGGHELLLVQLRGLTK
jgi:hypothetical protein